MKLGDFSMKSGEEMEKLFKENPDAVENTFKIAEMCDVKLSFLGKWVFPKLELKETKPEEYLTESARNNDAQNVRQRRRRRRSQRGWNTSWK